MRIAAILATAGTLVVALGAQARQTASQPSPAQQPSPAFRTGVDLVQVDVSVLDGNRQPVEGLSAGDFTVREDGKERPIAAFSAVELAARPPLGGAAPWTRDVASDVVTNAMPREGRLVVILFDRTIRAANMPAARATASAAVDQLGPADLAAVIYTARGVPQNFTADPRLLKSAIARPFIGLAGGDRGNPGECRCGVCTLEAITRVADALRDVPQRRKMLLFIGSSIPVESQGACSGIVQDARTKLFRAADVANLAIHSFDSNGLETLAPTAEARGAAAPKIDQHLQRQGDLAVYPDHTGGRAIANTNEPADLVAAVFAESRSYYVLGFAPANPRHDGKFHDLKVTVARQGVAVHPRLGYYAPADPARAAKAVKGGPPSSLVAAQASLWPTTGVPLSVSVAPFANVGTPDAAVAVVVRAHESLIVKGGPPPAPLGAQRVNVLASAYDRSGGSLDYHVQTIEVTPRPDAQTTLDYEVVSRLTLKPGRHEIRVAAENVTRGTSGSVYTYVDIPDFAKAPLSLSGVVIGPTGAPPATAAVMGDLLPLKPVAAREFNAADHVTAFVRVYQGGSDAAAPVTLTTRILDDHNQAVFEQRTAVFDSEAAAPRSADYHVDLPLAPLKPGEYLLRIQAGGQKPTVTRDVRFTMH